MTTVVSNGSRLVDQNPQPQQQMTLGQRVLPMSPEVIRKYGNGLQGMSNSDSPDIEHELVTALEQTLDSSKEIILAEESKQDRPLEAVTKLEIPELESPETAELIVVSESSTELSNFFHSPRASKGSHPDLFDVHVDISENPNEDSDTLSTGSDEHLALCLPPNHNKRRHSNWSAHVLFLASEVQLMVNLADFSPDDGYETKPTKVGLLTLKAPRKKCI